MMILVEYNLRSSINQKSLAIVDIYDIGVLNWSNDF